MGTGTKRLLTVVIVVLCGVAASVWFVTSTNRKMKARLASFETALSSSPDEAITWFVRDLRLDRDLNLWLTSYLKKPKLYDPLQCAAAHALSLSLDSEFSLPLQTRFAAFHYRFRAGLPLLQATDINGARGIVEFEKPRTYADAKNYDALFWYSFFSMDAMRNFYRTYGFDEFQRLLQAIMYYPYDRNTEGPFPRTPARAAAIALISRTSLESLLTGKFELPLHLSDGSNTPLKMPVILENKYGSHEAFEWYKSAIVGRPGSAAKVYASIAKLADKEASDFVTSAFGRGAIPLSEATNLFAPCYEHCIPMPVEFIEEGLKSADENVRVIAMMNVLNLEPTIRRMWVRRMLENEDLFTKYFLIHRLGPDDVDAGSVDLLKRQFRRDLSLDWGVSKMESLVIAAKMYELYGKTGLLELLTRDLFETYGNRMADVVELLGGPAEIVEYDAFVKWAGGLEGQPVWWIIGSSVLPEDVKADAVYPTALGRFYELINDESESVPSSFWRPLFVADSLDPAPRHKRDATFPLKLFGLMQFENPWAYLEDIFWWGDSKAAGIVLTNPDVMGEFFFSFETRLLE